ncbi:MAG: RIP metalloprotease RseP [Clostridia bacterium]|nr:RIP metalloprotease RseP [Clostridia bacterium]MBR6641925.1 RIP metalloprotease RseP [Clostridia bacterium]
MALVLTIIKLIIVLSVVATIHEFGHFLFAKLFKMTVNEFSIGFGPKIFSKEYKGTKYSLRWILFGGYVAIEGEEGDSEDDNAFNKKPCWQRIIVLVAGVLFNAILATVLFLGTNMVSPTFGTKISGIYENGAAYVAGLREGDIITKIEDKVTHIYQDVALYNKTDKKDVTVEYLRDGKTYTTLVKDAVKKIGYMGVYFEATKLDEEGNVLTYVQVVEPGMPAASKIKAGDKILKVNGKETKLSIDVISEISANAEKEVTILVLRDDKEVEVKLVPDTKLSFDLGLSNFAEEKTTVKTAFYKSVSTISQIVGSYVDLFRGKVKVNQLSGIVGIGEMVSRTDGIAEFLSMMAMISLAVGIANILPFPPLDGGKVVLVLIEWITKKKVPEKVELILSYIGLGLLLALTVFVTINDIIRVV